MQQLAVVFEADADCVIATELADRAIVDGVDWLDDSMLDAQRKWISKIKHQSIRWKTIPALARKRGIRVHGHFAGEPGLPDAQAARRAILLLKYEFEQLDAIVLIRDADKQEERRAGMDQARRLFPSILVVIGLAVPEREAWVISGFEPSDADEEESLREERARLGFDPRLRSHDLTATSDDQARKSPKQVLRALTKGSIGRERECWTQTSLAILRKRGQQNGLDQYLAEVTSMIVPLIRGTLPT